MEREEKIQRLAERMKVTPEEAARALDETGGDLLDAALLLERGRGAEERVVHSHSTAAATAQLPVAAETAEQEASTETKAKEIATAILSGLANHPILNGVEIAHHGKRLTVIPGAILLLLLVVRFWIAPLLFAVGLMVGWHFTWVGPQWNNDCLNTAWGRLEEKAARWREKMKSEKPHG